MDRKLIVGALALLFIQIFLLVSDLDIYPGHEESGASPAANHRIGWLVDKKQNVKRRVQGSVVWEDSEKSDTLLGNDSILTLENSSAQLELDNNVRINLHENTLVVLEPPGEEADESLRIRFSRGNLLAKNGGQKIRVGSGEWQLQALPGTDLSLKTLDNEKVEVQVTSGSVEVRSDESPNKVEQVAPGSRFTLDKSTMSEVKTVSSQLVFEQRSEERLYSHEFPIPFIARWKGDPDRLRIVQPGQEPKYISIPPDQESHQLDLTPGTYYLSLAKGDEISSEVIVRALPAPAIRYTSPLPRDRFAAGDSIPFSWLPLEGAKKYELSIANSQRERWRADAAATRSDLAVPLEGELQLRVFGIDDLGFRIPPQYSLPLFIIRDPLAPPKLENPTPEPTERTPAQDKPHGDEAKSNQKTFHWLAVLLWPFTPTAMADDQKAEDNEPSHKLVFSWFEVQGADFYNIEVSSDSSFSAPEVLTKVTAPSFTWMQYQKKVYYWRVAAGSNSGRMGLFSQTAMVDLTKVHQLKTGEISPGVRLVSDAPAKPVATTSKPPPAEPAPALAPEPRTPEPTREGHWTFLTEADFHHLSYSFEHEFSASLSGFVNLAGLVGFDFEPAGLVSDSTLHRARWSYLQTTWEPKDLSLTPYQNELQSSSHTLTYLYFFNRSELGYGMQTLLLPTLSRADLERLETDSQWLVGPTGGYDLQIKKGLVLESTGSLLFGGGWTALSSENKMRYRLSAGQVPVYVGGDFNFMIHFGSDSRSGFYLRTGLNIGAEW
jgi:hypothetical protein